MYKYSVILLLLIGCTPKGSGSINLVLKRQLDSIAGYDQRYRAQLSEDDMEIRHAYARAYGIAETLLDSLLWAKQLDADSTNLVFIAHIIAQYGYPGETLVGNEANTSILKTNEVAYFVIQHSREINRYIEIIKTAAQLHELPADRYAMMYDRLQMQRGKPQLFGTQRIDRIVNGNLKTVLWPVLYPQFVNPLRCRMGFESQIEEFPRIKHAN